MFPDGTDSILWVADFRPYGEKDALSGTANTEQRCSCQCVDILNSALQLLGHQGPLTTCIL